VKVFHRDVFMPDCVYEAAAVVLCQLGGRYRLSTHAKNQRAVREVTLPQPLPIAQLEIIEVTTNGVGVEKMLLRFKAVTGTDDVVMGLTNSGLVTTVYHNKSDDRHFTLNTSKYERTT